MKPNQAIHNSLVFLLFFLLILLRRPDMIINPQPWAEDGILFIQDHISLGISAFFKSYAGYLHLFPRIITFFSVHVSEFSGMGLQLVPLLMNFLSICTAAFCISYLLSSDFDWLSDKKTRFLAACSIVCIPNIPEVFGTATNVNWWLGIYQVLVALYIWEKRCFPSYFITAVFLTSSLSGPMIVVPCALITYSVLVQYLKRIKVSIRTIILYTLTITTTFIQLIISILNRQISDDHVPTIVKFIITFPKTVLIGVFDRLVFPDYQFTVQLLDIPTAVLVGSIVLQLIIYLNKSRTSVLVFSMSYLLILMGITFIGANFLFDLYTNPFFDVAQRYFFVPVALTLLLFFTSYQNTYPVAQKAAYFGVAIIIALNSVLNFSHQPYTDFQWKEHVKRYNKNSSQICEVPINPPGFKMYLPCD